MPFGDDTVEINYIANVTGIENVEALAAANADVQATTQQYTQSVNTATDAQNKHTNSMIQAGREATQLRRAFIGLLLPITIDVAILNEMAKGSEVIAASMENSGNIFATWAGKVGNAVAFAGQVYGAMAAGMNMDDAMRQAKQEMAATTSLKTQVAILDLQSKTYKAYGDDLSALKAKQRAEDLQLQEKYQGDAYNKLKTYLDQAHAAEMDAFTLSELGLEEHAKTVSNFYKDLVGGFQKDTGGIIGNFISGKADSPTQMLQSFRDTLGKAVGDAISMSLFQSMAQGTGIGGFFSGIKDFFTGDSPAARAQRQAAQDAKDAANRQANDNKQMLDLLTQIRDCSCSTASTIGSGMSATITPPKVSGLQKAAAISGLVASVASLGNLGGGGGANGGYAPGYSASNPPTLTIGTGGQAGHSGGWVPSFPSGGEVPIMAMPGEYIVRRPAAQTNKDLLTGLNNGTKPVTGTSNVFIIKTNDANSFAEMLASPAAQAQIEIAVIRSIMMNGNIRNTIKNYAT